MEVWMRSRRLLAVLFVLGLLAAGCGDDSEPSASPGASDGTIQVRAGVNDGNDLTIAVLEFLPEKLTVESGAKVRWTIAGPEPHTVTFLPTGTKPPTPDKASPFFVPTPPKGPVDGTVLVNSGFAPDSFASKDPATFEAEFEKPGTYPFVCVLHPLMTGSVTVVPEGQAADTQEAVNTRANTELGQWLGEGRAVKKQLVDKPTRTTTSGGKTTHWIEMGATTQHVDVLAYAPSPAGIKAGDDVVFINNSGAPHTATFANGNKVPSTLEEVESPAAVNPAPGKSPQTLNSEDLFNTGWLPPNAPPGAGPPEPVRSYRYTVPAGQYSYVCLLHAPSGMAGAINAT
jgi:plastocyanin